MERLHNKLDAEKKIVLYFVFKYIKFFFWELNTKVWAKKAELLHLKSLWHHLDATYWTKNLQSRIPTEEGS